MSNVSLVVVSYYLAPKWLARIISLLALILRIDLESVVIVDNRSKLSGIFDDKFTVIPGSNSLYDFSGYFEGLNHLLGRVGRIESVLFINDSIFIKHSFIYVIYKLARFSQFIRNSSIPTISGVCETYKSVLFVNPLSNINVYISTYAFVLNKGSIDILSEIFTRQLYRFDDDKFNEFVHLHLNEPSYSINIFSAVSNLSLEQLNKKIHSIKFEHCLSGIIAKRGCIVPINATARERFYIQATRILTKVFNLAIRTFCLWSDRTSIR
jgi:hypothetical protein